MPQIKDVMTGEVATGTVGDVLRSSAIGSCVVISAYCRKTRSGGLAHVMLPGYAPHEETSQQTRYAGNAINELLRQMCAVGVDINGLDVCLVGAGNVLKRPDDTTAKNNLDSVTELLREKKIKIRAESVGGTTRRSVTFDISKESVFYTVGDEDERLLWAAEEKGLREWISELEESRVVIKRTEKRLRESEGRLRDIMDSMVDWVWEVDENGVYTFTSQEVEKFLGVGSESVIGKTPFDFMLPAEARRVAAIFSEIVLKRAPIRDLENWNIRKDGAVICLLTNGMPVIDEEGQFKGYRGVDKDITERKRAEAAVQKSEVLYRSLFDGMRNGAAFCRMHYDDSGVPCDFTYLSVNRAFESQTGLKNVVGRKASEVILGIREADPELMATYGRVARTGKPENFEMFVSSLKMWFLVSVYSPSEGCFVALFDVVTERKKAEEKLHDQMRELKIFYTASIGREERIIELKREVDRLKAELGK